MDDVLTADSPVLFLFLYLLPGFLGMAVYGFLVDGQSQDKFDRVVTAFVLSLLSALCVHYVAGQPLIPTAAVTSDTPMNAVLQGMIDRNLLYSSIAAVLIAAVFAVLNNYGLIYAFINGLKISYKAGSSDVWEEIFYRNRGIWLKLKYEDGRILIGWPKYFSSTDKPRELFLARATWSHFDEQGQLVEADVAGPGVYVADFTKVTDIEVLN